MKTIFFLAILLSTSATIAQTRMNGDTLIALQTDSVSVSSKKPFIQNLVDRTVLNIESRTASIGQNALELLKSAPGVVVDANENIQMGGQSGVTVLIDGRNTQLSGQDLAQILKSIESDNIKEIELMNTPSSRFDAAGNAGIINIKLKKSITNGLNGSIGGSWSQSTHARQNGSFSLNARNGKWNMYTNLGINNGLQYTMVENNRLTQTKNYVQRGDERDEFNSASARTGVDYSINKKSTVGVMWLFNTRYTGMDNRNSTWLQQAGAPDTNVFTRSISPFHTNRNNININYRFVPKEGTEVTIDADATRFVSSLDNIVQSEMQNQQLTKFATTAAQNMAGVNIDIQSIKADYATKMGKNVKLEAGIKAVMTKTENELQVLQHDGLLWKQDTSKTNRFHFTEQIQAAYISVEKKWNHWQMQMGLRAENSIINGASVDLAKNRLIKPDTAYCNLFPTLFLQYSPDQSHQFGFTYGKRIDRPNYQDQNPFIYVLDAFNSEQGNPYLLPQITHSAEIRYTYKEANTIKIKYAHTDHYLEFVTYQTGNKTINIPQNVGSRQMLNINLSSSFAVAKNWNVYAYAEPFYQQYRIRLDGFGFTDAIRQNSWGFNGYMSHSFSFTKGWKAELTGWFNYQNTTTIYTSKPFTSMNMGISKKLMKDKATLTFSISDIFNTQRWEQTAQTRNLQLHTYRKWESSNVTIGFSYRFGNTKIKSATSRTSGAAEEMDRIK